MIFEYYFVKIDNEYDYEKWLDFFKENGYDWFFKNIIQNLPFTFSDKEPYYLCISDYGGKTLSHTKNIDNYNHHNDSIEHIPIRKHKRLSRILKIKNLL